jgi:hypothetical protein
MAKTDITLITVGIHPPASQRQASHSLFSQVSWTSVCIGLKLEVVATNPWAGKQSRQQQQQRGAGRNDFSIHYRGRTDGRTLSGHPSSGLDENSKGVHPFQGRQRAKKGVHFWVSGTFCVTSTQQVPSARV